MTEPPVKPELDPQLDIEDEAEKDTRGPMRWVFYGLAFVLLGVCVWLAVGGAQAEEGPSGWQRLSEADPVDVAWMLALVAAAMVVNGWIFWVIVKPFEWDRPVGLTEMTALIGATSLLNYLPMRAGLIGRAAYLKRRHEIGYKASVLMMLLVAGGTVYVFAVLVGMTLWRPSLDAMWWGGVAAAMAVAAAVATPATRLGLRWTPEFASVPTQWFEHAGAAGFFGAFGMLLARTADVMLLAGRLWLAAGIFGTPIDWPAAVVMASGGMFITLATPLPNGLGLREAVYGAFAAVGVSGEAMPTGSMGVAVGLIDRAVEAVIFILVGLAAMAYLHRKG